MQLLCIHTHELVTIVNDGVIPFEAFRELGEWCFAICLQGPGEVRVGQVFSLDEALFFGICHSA